jgi:hypothetical protein
MVDLANIIAGALVFGQLVSGQVVDMGKIGLGIMLAGVFYVGSPHETEKIVREGISSVRMRHTLTWRQETQHRNVRIELV